MKTNPRKTSVPHRDRSTESSPSAERRLLIRRAVLQASTLPLLFGLVVFLPAGTLAWPMAWALMAAYLAGMLLTNLWLVARHPGLARERLIIPRSSEKWDLRLVGIVNFLLLAVALPLAGLDHQFGISPALPAFLPAGALFVFAAMFVCMAGAMSVNEFFSSAVRLQNDREQTVATEGPYRYLRHPGYLAMIVQFLAVPLILGSLPAMLPAAAIAAVYVYRTHREDRLLLEKLPGYAEYARRVPYRLIPGIW